MSLLGKLESEFVIKATPSEFHDFWSCKPHHVTHASPGKVQGCTLHEGSFGSSGSTISWDYVHDGKAKVAKQKIAIDDENNKITFKMLEGDLMEEYKNFIITVQATPKDGGSLVLWTFEYEKLNENIPDPKTLLEFLTELSKEIDGHLQQQA